MNEKKEFAYSYILIHRTVSGLFSDDKISKSVLIAALNLLIKKVKEEWK